MSDGPVGGATSVRPFRFGIQVNKASSNTEFRETARKVEDLGYSTFFVSDHYLDRNLPPAATNDFAPIAAMATAAAVTETVRIGCRVFCIDYHVPAVLAKEAATLDFLSDGRLEFGIGAGWSEGEYQAMGLTFAEAPSRVDKLEEVVALLKAHWSGEDMDLSGQHVNVKGYAGLPLPVQRPHPALIIGGNKKRVLSLAAREADIVSIAIIPFVPRNELGLTPEEEAARRLRLVRDAAGDRFGDLDIEGSPYYAEITTDHDAAVARVVEIMKCPPGGLLDHPNVLIGTTDEIVDRLIHRREVTGVNYVTVQQSLLEVFAPVVDRLNGR